MHELTIAQNIFEIICSIIPEPEYHKIEVVKIRLGKLSNVSPRALQYGFNTLKEDAGFENVTLIIEEEPLHLFCRDCNQSFISDDIIFSCVYCKGINLEVTEGDMLQLSEIILTEEV
ncbi:MAG: hydrogenase maturation nickel metallochaperone HypA [Ignavibacteriales bacterium]